MMMPTFTAALTPPLLQRSRGRSLHGLTERAFRITLSFVRPLPIANPSSAFSATDIEYFDGEAPDAGFQVFEDSSRTVVAKNDSPDVGFDFSVNPYRGCMHACAYCYARPSHEYLGFGAGTDFDRKIVVKRDAAELLRAAFDKRSWRGDVVVFSGVTDCYQPLEATYGVTRACLEVCVEYKNPVGIITKSALIERDVDVLTRLAAVADLGVTISIPFFNTDAARAIEPYAPSPARRIRAIRTLAAAGLDVNVNVAPIIPGLSDEDIPKILEAAAAAGAKSAGRIILRLPGPVRQVFEERIRASMPLRADKILRRIQDTRGGKMNDSRFGSRMEGEGVYADSIHALFDQTIARLGLRPSHPRERRHTFERPLGRADQMKLW
jgi:DNA repair photolyase